MGASSGVAESSDKNSITFSKFDTSVYDANGEYVKNLKIKAPKTLVEKAAEQATIERGLETIVKAAEAETRRLAVGGQIR